MEDMIKYLENIRSMEGQDQVFCDLKSSCKLNKSPGTYYTLDLENILGSPHFMPLKEAKSLEDLYSAVRNVIGGSYDGKPRRSDNFSEALESGQGDCMEKSVLFQIAMDFFRKTENHPLAHKKSFYVVAAIKQENESQFSRHAFNIVASEMDCLLIDLENPLFSDIPYIVPAQGVHRKNGKIIIPKTSALGRTYNLSG